MYILCNNDVQTTNTSCNRVSIELVPGVEQGSECSDEISN